MQNSYQNDSIMDDSVSSNNNRAQQYQKQQQQNKFVSNRQKILNLHERIKMLDQIGNNHQQQKISSNIQNTKQYKNQEHQYNQEINKQQIRKVGSQKTFLNRSLSPKIQQTQKNIQKQKDLKNFFKQNIQSPTHNLSNQSNNIYSNQQTSNPTFLNNSHSSQHSQSASRLPYSQQSPKHQIYESQNMSNSLYRSPLNPTNDFFPLEARYLSIEDKFLQFKMSEQNLLRNIEQEIRDLQENCKQMKRQHQKAEKRNQQTIENIEKSLSAQINELSVQLKDVKKGAIQSLDTKHKAIRCQTIAMIAQQFESQCKLASSQVQTQLQSAQRLLQKQQNLRDETAQFLINSFGDEIIKLEEVLNTQRQTRIKKNDELLKLINSVQDQLMDKLQKQKRQMIQNVENMQNMLEQVCYKIQQKILGN